MAGNLRARLAPAGIELANSPVLPRLERAVAEVRSALYSSERLALLLVNLDRFKLVNDVCGHATGDAVLNIVARHRLGGMEGVRTLHLAADEFACLLSFSGDAEVDAFARLMLQIIAKPIVMGQHIIHLTASIGTAVEAGDRPSPEQLLRAASIALSHAKEAGGDAIRCFQPTMFTDLCDRAELEEDLRSGIVLGDIVPYYQPIVALDSGLTTGFEALVRWQHPRQGLLGPDRFLPIAEETGLDRDLLFATLRQVCRDARDWPSHFTASINLSPSQLCDPGNAVQLLQILFANGFAPGRLIVEITENAVINDLGNAAETIRSLRNAGISVALDDFGTGYASLSRLCDLEIDHIKIDRSLIHSLDREAGCKLVKAVVDLGRSLSMPITAEGIETAEQAHFLRSLDCAYGQGFLFAAALPASAARRLVRNSCV